MQHVYPLKPCKCCLKHFLTQRIINRLIPGDTVKWFTLYNREGESRRCGLSTEVASSTFKILKGSKSLNSSPLNTSCMNQHGPELQKNTQTVLSMTESLRPDYRIQNIAATNVNVEDNDSTSVKGAKTGRNRYTKYLHVYLYFLCLISRDK
jgi:hypothetical protein